MNYLQKMWVKVYQDYLNAAKATAESRGEALNSNEIFMARKQADLALASLINLGK